VNDDLDAPLGKPRMLIEIAESIQKSYQGTVSNWWSPACCSVLCRISQKSRSNQISCFSLSILGAAKPSQVVSHRLSLDEVPNAFAKFDARQEGYIKVILKP
jgi:hypothetical protein